MTLRRVTANEALADGMTYVGDAWRDLWGIQALVAAGIAMVFVAWMGKGAPDNLFPIGAAVALVAMAPLYGALYRIDIGGRAERTLGPLGLQLGMVEGRLWSIWAARAAGLVAAFLGATALSAIVFVVLGDIGMVHLGPLGPIKLAFLVAFAVWLAGAGVLLWVLARLSLASPASVAADRLVLAESWPMSAGRAVSLAAVWVAVRIPSFLLLLAFALIDQMENGRIPFRPWPLMDAVVGGALAGVVLAFVQAPLAVGALNSVWRRARPERKSAAFASLDDTAPPRPPIANGPRVDPTERFRRILGDRPEPAR